MHFDGMVTAIPVSDNQGFNPDGSISFSADVGEFSYYAFSDTGNQPQNPPLNSSSVGHDVAILWSENEDWAFVGYEFCSGGCGGVPHRVNIYNPETAYSREISSCGSHFACVNWLPENVNLANLPIGQDYSVLPFPDNIEYSRSMLIEGGYNFFQYAITHEIACESGQEPAQVYNLETGDIVFTLPNRQHCPTMSYGEISPVTVIFAVSPNHQYYAITDDSEFTALYHADTGNLIARFNFYGIRLAFSEDSSQLITSGRFAEATWDIQRLIEQYEMP